MTQREKIKDWLLHLDSEDLDYFIEIANEFPWCNRYKDGNHCKSEDFVNAVSEKYGLNGLIQLQSCCIDDLGIDYDEDSNIFPDLSLALIAWLSYPKNKKHYKVLAKVNDIEKDFAKEIV